MRVGVLDLQSCTGWQARGRMALPLQSLARTGTIRLEWEPEMCRVAIQEFEPAVESVPDARHWVTTKLEVWGVSAQGAVAELLVTELMSNAIKHGAGRPIVSVSLAKDSIEVGVTDAGGGDCPTRRHIPLDTGRTPLRRARVVGGCRSSTPWPPAGVQRI